MKTTSSLLCFVLFLSLVYSLDNIGQLVEDILGDDDSFMSYFDCLMDRGKCPLGGDLLKEKLPVGIKTGCKDCNGANKKLFWTTVSFIAREKPKEFAEVLAKYDPAGTFMSKFGNQLIKE